MPVQKTYLSKVCKSIFLCYPAHSFHIPGDLYGPFVCVYRCMTPLENSSHPQNDEQHCIFREHFLCSHSAQVTQGSPLFARDQQFSLISTRFSLKFKHSQRCQVVLKQTSSGAVSRQDLTVPSVGNIGYQITASIWELGISESFGESELEAT